MNQSIIINYLIRAKAVEKDMNSTPSAPFALTIILIVIILFDWNSTLVVSGYRCHEPLFTYIQETVKIQPNENPRHL